MKTTNKIKEKPILFYGNDENKEKDFKETNKKYQIKQPKVFNLSKLTLSRYQVSILLRGLNFTPTPLRNNVQLKSDIQYFTHKLRLIECFHNPNKNEPTKIDYKKESLVIERFQPSLNARS